MKKILCALMCLVCMSTYAQEHIKFLGHYIDEPNYIENLEAEGKIVHKFGSAFTANIAGDDVMLLVKTNQYSHIYSLTFSKMGNECWNDLTKTYFKIKNLLMQKGYTIVSCEENTGVPPSLRESTYALHNIQNGDGKFETLFEIPNGYVYLYVASLDKENKYPEEGKVVTIYLDSKYKDEDSAAKNKQQLDDL